MRLIWFAQDFPPTTGGIQTYAVELARRLAPSVESFRVVAPQVAGCAEFDSTCDFEIERVRGGTNLFALRIAPILAGARGALTFHTQWPSAASAVAVRTAGTPLGVAVAAHGRELLLRPWSKHAVAQGCYDALRRQTLRRADRVFAVSRFTGEIVRSLGVSGDRLRIRGNGTNPDRFRKHRNLELRRRLGLRDDFVFLSVARLVPRKGVHRVVEALACLGADAKCQLVIVGDGPERGSIERLSNELGVGARVHMGGRVASSELPAWYALADAFVLPSESLAPEVEGFGIAFLEASASELPVIGPNVGGPLDAIEHGVTGLCVDPSDVGALANAMSGLYRDPSWARQLGQSGRRRVLAKGTWDHVAAGLLDELSEIRAACRPSANEPSESRTALDNGGRAPTRSTRSKSS